MTDEIKEEKVEKKEVSSELIQSLVDEVKILKQQNEMLIQVADKKALGTYYSRHQKDLPKIVRLNLIDGKVITSWAMLQNEVYKEAVGNAVIWREKQNVKLNLEDDSNVELSYMDFVRKYTQVEAKIISKTTNELTGELKLKVGRLDNGKEYEIDVRFVN